jgi:KaiC/GvpD/RAD55 family RecA-like ATPase
MSESEPARVPTGITGLDEMLGGGLPNGHVVLVTGLPGTGKTCFGLQFLLSGAAKGEAGVYLSLEEESPALLASAREFGWPIDAAVAAGTVKVLRIDPKQTHQNLQRIQSDLGKELKSLAPKRVVVDSVSLLNMLSDDEPSRRATLFGLAAACRDSGATTVLTAEADPLHPAVTRDGLSEYIADGVVLLGYSTGEDGRRVGLSLRILKMRRTAHARTVQPYQIGPGGITVDAKAIDFGRSR